VLPCCRLRARGSHLLTSVSGERRTRSSFILLESFDCIPRCVYPIYLYILSLAQAARGTDHAARRANTASSHHSPHLRPRAARPRPRGAAETGLGGGGADATGDGGRERTVEVRSA